MAPAHIPHYLSSPVKVVRAGALPLQKHCAIVFEVSEMSQFPVYCTCPEVKQVVRIDQSEGDCRSQHGCEQACCPLAQEFEPDRFNFLIAATGSSFRAGR